MSSWSLQLLRPGSWWVVSLTFREFFKIISRKCTIPKITWWEFQAETLYVCPKQSHALGTHTTFQLEILTRNRILAIHKFWENILGEFAKRYWNNPLDSWDESMLKSILVTLLASRRFEWNFTQTIFKLILVTDDSGISCEIALRLMSLDLPDDNSTLVPVMAWGQQATSHYLSQCWPRFMLLYGTTKPQAWVN